MKSYIVNSENQRIAIDLASERQAAINQIPHTFTQRWLDAKRNHLLLILDGRPYDLEIEGQGSEVRIRYRGRWHQLSVADARFAKYDSGSDHDTTLATRHIVKAPMPGMVLKVLVVSGQKVNKGDRLVVLEAMKMENDVKSPYAGTVTQVAAEPGKPVEAGRELVVIE